MSIFDATMIPAGSEGVFSLCVDGEWIDVSIAFGRLWRRSEAFCGESATTADELERLLGIERASIQRFVRVPA